MERKCFECTLKIYTPSLCLTCHRYVCSSCEDSHLLSNNNHRFSLINFTTLFDCSEHHHRSLRLYCISCKTPICEYCADHKQHDIKSLYGMAKDVMPKLREDVKIQLTKIETMHEKIEREISVRLGYWEEYKRTIKSIDSYLTNDLQKYIDIGIHQTKLKLSDMTKYGVEPKTDKFIECLENLQINKVVHNEWKNGLLQIFSEKSSSNAILMYKQLQENLEKIFIKKIFDTDTPLPNPVYQKPTNEELNRLFHFWLREDPRNESKTSSSEQNLSENFKQNILEKDKELEQLNQIIKAQDKELRMAKATLEHIGINTSRLNAANQRADITKIIEFEWPENLKNFPEIDRHVQRFQSSMNEIEEFIEKNQILLEKQRTKEACMGIQSTASNKEEELRSHLKMANVEIQNMQKRDNDLQKSLETLDKEYSSTKRHLEKSQNEVEDLRTRLSQMAGAKLVSGNSSITDLGDKYRPTRIAEMYAEMYDTEWTDAIENITKNNRRWKDDLIARHLFVVLQACFHTCLRIATEQMKTLCQQLFMHVTPEELDSYTDKHIVEVKQLRDSRRMIAYDMALALAKKIFAKQRFKTMCSGFNDIDMSLIQEVTQTTYAEKCVIVCWFMAVQDPEMYLDKDLKAGSPLNKELYKEYTQNGKKVEFSIWPALFLHKDGPLLAKGVAQVC